MGSITPEKVTDRNLGSEAQNTLNVQAGLAQQLFDLSNAYAPIYANLYNKVNQSALLGTEFDAQKFDADHPGFLEGFKEQQSRGELQGWTPEMYAKEFLGGSTADVTKYKTGGLLQQYQQYAPALQNLQQQLNTSQRAADISDVANLGYQAREAYQQANPQLTALSNEMYQRAMNAQNPMNYMNASSFTGAAPVSSDNVSAQQINALQGVGNVGAQNVAAQNIGAERINALNLNDPRMGVQAGNVRDVFSLSPYERVTSAPNVGSQALLGNALGELAKGGSLGFAEQRGIENAVADRYNQAGRANDPIAIANMALGLDSAQQARLAQRQGAVATAAGLTQGDLAQRLSALQGNQGAQLQLQNLGLGMATSDVNRQLAAQQTNQSAFLQGQGLSLNQAQTNQDAMLRAALANQSSGLQAGLANQSANLQAGLANQQAATTANAQRLAQAQANQDAALRAALANQGSNLQALLANQQVSQNTGMQNAAWAQQMALANQQAQLQNAQYTSNLLGQTGNFLAGTAQDPFKLVLGTGSGLGTAAGTYGQAAGASGYQGLNQMFDPFSSYSSDLYNTNYNAANARAISAANNSAGLWGGLLGLGGKAAGAALGGAALGGWGNIFGSGTGSPTWFTGNPSD